MRGNFPLELLVELLEMSCCACFFLSERRLESVGAVFALLESNGVAHVGNDLLLFFWWH